MPHCLITSVYLEGINASLIACGRTSSISRLRVEDVVAINSFTSLEWGKISVTAKHNRVFSLRRAGVEL